MSFLSNYFVCLSLFISRIFFIILFLVNCCYASFETKVTYSLKSNTIQELLKIVDPSTLVLINIDNTIVTPKSKMFRYNNIPHKFFAQNLRSAASTMPVLNKRLALMLEHRKFMLVEPEWSDFIIELEDKGAMVLGLYHPDIQEYGMIKNLEELRYQQLKKLNVNFVDKIYDNNSFELGKKDNNAFFYKGILFSGFLNTAQTILEFLNSTYIMPSKIVLFEQNMNYINQVEYGLRIFDIEYHPVQYLAERKIVDDLDERVVRLQQDSLISNLQWLEDEEAEELLHAEESNPYTNNQF